MYKPFYPPLNSVNPVILKDSVELASQPTSENKLKALKPRAIPTALTPFSEADSAALAKLLSENASSNFTTQTFRGRQIFAALFVNQTARGRLQVQVPENGDFNLRISEGASFDIVDANATDGEAHIVLPAATFETVFHLQRNRRADTVLKVKDPLYNVQDELTSNKYKWIDLNRFLGLGKRPVPVPASWQSDDGADLVLNFEAQNLEGFQMLWYETDEPVDLPPGIAEIGAAGGVVELAGVGRLEVPAGALEQSTVVRLKSLNEVIEPIEISSEGSDVRRFMSGAVQLYTENKIFLQPAWLELELDAEALAQNDPFVVSWSNLQTIDDVKRWYRYRFEQESSQGQRRVKVNIPGVYARTAPSFITPETKYRPVRGGGFQVQQSSSDGCGNYSTVFVLDAVTSAGIEPELPSASCFLSQVYDYYSRLITQAGGVVPDDTGLVYIGGSSETKPRTYPELYNPVQSEPFFTLPVPSNMDGFEETLAHELWHVFQYKNSLNSLTAAVYYAVEEWLLEGPAVHMGAKAALEYGKGDIIHYKAMIAVNQASLMPVTVKLRDPYETAGFFSYYVKAKSGELALAQLAVDYSNKTEEMYSLNKNFGYEALKKSPFFDKEAEISIQERRNKLTLTERHTRETPFNHYESVPPFATEYIRVNLDQGLDPAGKYTLLAKLIQLDGSSSAKLTLSAKGKKPSEFKATYDLVNDSYVKIENIEIDDTAFITVSNGNPNANTGDYSTTDNFEVNLALEREDKSRVSVETSSEYSIGIGTPVTVTLSIKDVNGDPLTGRAFIGLDRNNGTFRSVSPTYNESYTNARYVDVEDGRVQLEYQANFSTGDGGRYRCGGDSQCKPMSARLKVAGCDFTYYTDRSRCPIWGPGKDLKQDGVESDEGRIYTTWLKDMVNTKSVSVKANGKMTNLSIDGLKDSADRSLPNGFPLYVNQPYWGQLYNAVGTPASLWVVAFINGGSAKLSYEAPYGPNDCWPPEGANTRDFVVFDDSRYAQTAGIAYEIKITPRSSDCD